MSMNNGRHQSMTTEKIVSTHMAAKNRESSCAPEKQDAAYDFGSPSSFRRALHCV